jgi:flavin reductase (DIM6/NTAB) family NADH-FMN oxidoreductase RutF
MSGNADVSFESLEMASLTEKQRYSLLMGSIVPRPIAFVSTMNQQGIVNVAPFSAFMSISAINSLVAVSVNERADGTKDTVKNIESRREFVINTVPSHLAHQVQACSKAYAPEISEVDEVGLTLVASKSIKTPRIVESRIHFECELYSMSTVESAKLIIGRVLILHAQAGLISDYKVALDLYAPLGRLGGRRFCEVGNIIDV